VSEQRFKVNIDVNITHVTDEWRGTKERISYRVEFDIPAHGLKHLDSILGELDNAIGHIKAEYKPQ
jgi:hypothetical protein